MRALPAGAEPALRRSPATLTRVGEIPRASSSRSAAAAAIAIAVAALVVGAAAVAHGEPYRVERERSEIVARVATTGPAAALAHDHVVRATAWQATLDVHRDPVALAADVRVDATALAVDEPDVRKRHGLDGELDDDDRAEVRATMLGASQLDVARHPEIRFVVSEVDRVGDGLRIAGELRLHGVHRRIALPLAVSESDGAVTASGTVRVKQSDFGIEPYRAFLGAVRNEDEVEIAFRLVAVPDRTR